MAEPFSLYPSSAKTLLLTPCVLLCLSKLPSVLLHLSREWALPGPDCLGAAPAQSARSQEGAEEAGAAAASPATGDICQGGGTQHTEPPSVAAQYRDCVCSRLTSARESARFSFPASSGASRIPLRQSEPAREGAPSHGNQQHWLLTRALFWVA